MELTLQDHIVAALFQQRTNLLAMVDRLTIEEALPFLCRHLRPDERWNIYHINSKTYIPFSCIRDLLVNHHFKTGIRKELVYEDYALEELRIAGKVKDVFIQNALQHGSSLILSSQEEVNRFNNWYFNTYLVRKTTHHTVA